MMKAIYLIWEDTESAKLVMVTTDLNLAKKAVNGREDRWFGIALDGVEFETRGK